MPALEAWLLHPEHVTVRRLAIARLGLRDPAGAEAPPPPVVEEPWVRALLVEPRRPAAPDCPVHPYQKWGGVHWRLAWLAELDVPPTDAVVAPVLEDGVARVVAWLGGRPRLARARPVAGRTRMCASMEGLAAWAAVRNGLAADPRVAGLVERLVAWQWPDGGWNCDRRPAASHASFDESWAPLRALAAFARTARTTPLGADAREAAGRAAEFLLVHGVVNSHRTGRLAHPSLDGQRWPPYWHYDRLVGLRVLAEAGRLDDPRAARAIEELRAAAGPDGAWRPDRRFWRPPGARGSGVEAVDWGTEGSAKMVTLQALEVLGARPG